MLFEEKLAGRREHWGIDISDRRRMPKGHRAEKASMDKMVVELESILEIICGLNYLTS